jgi:Rieske 2Fe-2S family protein
MQILSGRGRCPKVLRCPYHGWTYRQDGRLAAVPEARGFPALDREGVALPSFRVESLAGLVFVSLDAEVPPLAEWFGDVAERLETLGIAGLKAEGPLVVEYPYNWKNLADNYLEGYHIPVGHPGLLRMLDYKRYEPALGRRHAWISAPLRDKPSVVRRERLYQRLVRPMPGLRAPESEQWNFVFAFPGTTVNLYPDQIDFWLNYPLDERRTLTIWNAFRPPETSGRRDRLVRRLNSRINHLVQEEDNELTERVQEGLESSRYRAGVIGVRENGIKHFHDLVRAAIPAAAADDEADGISALREAALA